MAPSADVNVRAVRCAVMLLVSGCAWLLAAGCDDDAGRAGGIDAAANVDSGHRRADASIDAAGPRVGSDASVIRDAASAFDAMPSSGGEKDAAADAGSGSSGPRARLTLVDQLAWTPVAAADDPFDDRPSDVTCDAAGYGFESFGGEDAYAVDTAKCSYHVATQRSLAEVRPGERVLVRLWLFALTGPTGAEAHVEIRLDGIALLDETIAIPSDGGLLKVGWIAPNLIPAGVPVFLHIHNHGANSYDLLELSTGAVN